jgi:urease accessory protein UreH
VLLEILEQSRFCSSGQRVQAQPGQRNRADFFMTHTIHLIGNWYLVNSKARSQDQSRVLTNLKRHYKYLIKKEKQTGQPPFPEKVAIKRTGPRSNKIRIPQN